jgi:hypothetical protein
MKYTVIKRDGLWWVVDAEGFEVSYVGYELKKEALDSARVRAWDEAAADEYDRDLKLRIRNGQVGSGMKVR